MDTPHTPKVGDRVSRSPAFAGLAGSVADGESALHVGRVANSMRCNNIMARPCRATPLPSAESGPMPSPCMRSPHVAKSKTIACSNANATKL